MKTVRKSKETNPPKIEVVTELGHNDVLLGRGAGSINYVGNVLFREIVKERRDEYLSTARRQTKDNIARQIVDVVATRNGRFLRKVKTKEERQRLGVVDESNAWIVADNDKMLEKIKQSLRDREYNPEDRASRKRAENDGIDEENDDSNRPLKKQATPLNVFTSVEGSGLTAEQEAIRRLGESRSFLPFPMNAPAHQPLTDQQIIDSFARPTQNDWQQLGLAQPQDQALNNRLNTLFRQSQQARLFASHHNMRYNIAPNSNLSNSTNGFPNVFEFSNVFES